MQFDEFLTLVRKRRSIRRFKKDPVPDELITKIIDVARWSMSGANAQPWEFVVVKNKRTIKKIAELYSERQMSFVCNAELSRSPELRHHQVVYASKGLLPFKDAPVIIVVCGDPRTVEATVLGAHLNDAEFTTFHMNMANPVTMINLAASALGLGAQWVSMLPIWEASLKSLLGIPELYRVYTFIPVGYADYKPKGSWRRKVEEITHYDKYDKSKYRSHEQVTRFIVDLRKKTFSAYSVMKKDGD